VDTVKKAASKVGTRGVQVAARAGTRGARALVETTVAAVKTVDKLQEKLGRRPHQAPAAEVREPAKPRRTSTASTPEALPAAIRETGRKTMPAAAPKRSKKAPASRSRKQFKVKRGQKHLHSGR
jgi:hypothetical protein